MRGIFGDDLPFLSGVVEESKRAKEKAVKLIESRFSLWGISSQEITLPEFTFLGFNFPD